MHHEDARLIAAFLGVGRRPAEHLGPVGGEALDMLRMLILVGERMVELGVGQTPLVMGPREGEERSLAAGELEERGPRHRGYCS
jgi:hypothetical protein